MKRLLTILVVLAVSSAGLAQGGRAAEHWMGAWSTAVVVAPPLPAPVALRGAPPAAPGQPAAQPQPPSAAAPAPAAGQLQPVPQGGPVGPPPGPPGPPPVRNFNNQTLRLIVHTSIGGD